MIGEVKIEDYPKWRDENPNANEVWVNHGDFGKVHRTFNYKNPNDVTLCEKLGMYDGFGRFHFIDEEGTRHICYKPNFTFFKNIIYESNSNDEGFIADIRKESLEIMKALADNPDDAVYQLAKKTFQLTDKTHED